MAERVQSSLHAWHLPIEFSHDDWSNLASSVDLSFSEEIQARLLECVGEYVDKAISHHQAAPRQKVESALGKINKACKGALNELTSMLEPEETNEYDVTRMLLEIEHEKRIGRKLDLVSIISSLQAIEFLCKTPVTNLEYFGSRDTSLDFFLYELSEVFLCISEKGHTSADCIKFIHAFTRVACAKLLERAEFFYPNKRIFDKLRSVTNDTTEDGKGRIIARIESGRRLRINYSPPSEDEVLTVLGLTFSEQAHPDLITHELIERALGVEGAESEAGNDIGDG